MMPKSDNPTFTDVQFMTANQKAAVLRAWGRFLKGGLRPEGFTRALYDHLIQHCSFIAHYDRAGFYATYFQQPETTAQFFSQFDRRQGCVSVEYGMDGWIQGAEYSDLNNAMVDAAEPYLNAIYAACKDAERSRDLAEAARLAEKHGKQVS